MLELYKVGLGSSTTAEFLAKARNIVTHHRELQNQVEALHSQIGQLEMTQLRAVSFCHKKLCILKLGLITIKNFCSS